MDLFWGLVGAFVATAFGAWRARPAWWALVPGLAIGWYGVRAEFPGASGISTRYEPVALAALLAGACAGWAFALLARDPDRAVALARPGWHRWRSLAIAVLCAGLLASFVRFAASALADVYAEPLPVSWACHIMPCLLAGSVILAWRWPPLVVPLNAAGFLLALSQAIERPLLAFDAIETAALAIGSGLMIAAAVRWAGRDRKRWWGIVASFIVPAVCWASVLLLAER